MGPDVFDEAAFQQGFAAFLSSSQQLVSLSAVLAIVVLIVGVALLAIVVADLSVPEDSTSRGR